MDQSRRPLVVALDDETANLEFVARTLRGHFDVRIFTDPDAALSALREGPVAIVVSDQRMPQMTGVEFLSRASQVAPDSVRMLITAYADLGVAIDAVNRSHVSAILCKPVDAETLLKEVERGVRIHETTCRLRERLGVMVRENEILTRTISDLKRGEGQTPDASSPVSRKGV